jgi:methanogenic corrinoid protein MtbC1
VRTHSGQRLYTDKQVIQLKWMKAQMDAGLPAGKAARAVLGLERSGKVAGNGSAREPRLVHIRLGTDLYADVGDDPLQVIAGRLEAALLDRDLAAADDLLLSAVAVTDMSDVITRVVGPTLEAIGEGWRAGRVDIATEHLATAHLHHRIAGWLGSLPAVNGIGPVVLACPPGERHDGGLLMFALLLKRSGCPVAFLGPSLPFPDLERFALETHVSAIVLTAMLESTAQTLAHWPDQMPRIAEAETPLVCFGGGVFRDQPRLREGIRGHYLGDELAGGVDRLNQLLGRSMPPLLHGLASA